MRTLNLVGRSWLAVVGALMLVLVFGASPAAAQTATGIGTITARGTGEATIVGSGQVVVYKGFGELLISGADDIITAGRGVREDLPDGSVRLTGWAGDVTVRGTDLTVSIRGARVGFRADGSGEVSLRGRGAYEVNGLRGRWTAAGTTLTIEP